jgi:hypothetical protein
VVEDGFYSKAAAGWHRMTHGDNRENIPHPRGMNRVSCEMSALQQGIHKETNGREGAVVVWCC